MKVRSQPIDLVVTHRLFVHPLQGSQRFVIRFLLRIDRLFRGRGHRGAEADGQRTQEHQALQHEDSSQARRSGKAGEAVFAPRTGWHDHDHW
jgi:hypothetical protein